MTPDELDKYSDPTHTLDDFTIVKAEISQMEREMAEKSRREAEDAHRQQSGRT